MVIIKRGSWLAAVAAGWLLFASAKVSEQAAVEGRPRNTIVTQRQNRKIYKYSIVPGGIYSVEELSRARRLDRVVAAHYADFDARAAKLIQLSQAQLVYVSYRKADKVYWTKGRHKVNAGEAVVSDGKTMARSRCGNRLSKTPKLPVAKTEPAEAALGAPLPVPSHIAGPSENNPAENPLAGLGIEPAHPANTGAAPAEAMPRALTGANNGFPTPSSGAAFPPISSSLGASPTGGAPGGLLPVGGTSGGGTTTPGNGTTTPGSGTTPSGGTTTPIIPITLVPEPTSLLLCGLGLTLCGLRLRRR